MKADHHVIGQTEHRRICRIGTVISVDLAKIAQAQPGQKVRFVNVESGSGQDLYIELEVD